jgi:hypothetical protein
MFKSGKIMCAYRSAAIRIPRIPPSPIRPTRPGCPFIADAANHRITDALAIAEPEPGPGEEEDDDSEQAS